MPTCVAPVHRDSRGHQLSNFHQSVTLSHMHNDSKNDIPPDRPIANPVQVFEQPSCFTWAQVIRLAQVPETISFPSTQLRTTASPLGLATKFSAVSSIK